MIVSCFSTKNLWVPQPYDFEETNEKYRLFLAEKKKQFSWDFSFNQASVE